MTRAKAVASVLTVVTALAGARCAPIQSGQRSTSQVPPSDQVVSRTPVIDSARPDSVLVPYGGVVEVTLFGGGFASSQSGMGANTVHFDGTALSQVPASSDGRRIVFVVPDVIRHTTGAPPTTLAAGSYTVSVETIAGTSNVVTIRVYR